MQSVRTTHAPQDCVVRRTDCYCLSWAAIGVAAIIAPLLRHRDRNRTRAESQTGTAHTDGSGDPIRERERVGYCSRGLHTIVAAPSEPTIHAGSLAIFQTPFAVALPPATRSYNKNPHQQCSVNEWVCVWMCAGWGCFFVCGRAVRCYSVLFIRPIRTHGAGAVREQSKQKRWKKNTYIPPTHTTPLHYGGYWFTPKNPRIPTRANHPPLHSVPLALGSTKHYSTMGAAVPLSSFLLSAAPPVRRRSTCELSNRSTFAYCASSVEAFEAFYVVVMFLLLLYTFCQLSPGQASVLGGRWPRLHVDVRVITCQHAVGECMCGYFGGRSLSGSVHPSVWNGKAFGIFSILLFEWLEQFQACEF